MTIEAGFKVVGLDMSLTGTGFAVFNSKGRSLMNSGVIETSPKDYDHDIRRMEYIAKTLLYQGDFSTDDFVCIEDYAFHAKGQITRLAELVGITKCFILRKIPTSHLLLCSPTTAKKYAFGKGNIPKDLVVKSVYKRFGFDTDNNNEADAYVLGMLALDAVVPRDGMVKYEKEAVDTIKKGNKHCFSAEYQLKKSPKSKKQKELPDQLGFSKRIRRGK